MSHLAPVDAWNVYAHLRDAVQWAKCDRCAFLWPERMLNVRKDGRKICPNHSTYRETSADVTARIERKATRLLRGKEPEPRFPHVPEMRGVSGVSLLTPHELELTPGGASGILILTGRNLSDADVIVLPATVTQVGLTIFTAIDPDTRGNTATLTLQSPALSAAGDYNLLFNQDTFPRVLKVRV